MRERHPIDDVFRRGLAAAEVEPPAAVWEGVLRQRAGRRRLVVVWRRFRWMGLLALLVGAPVLWWASSPASVLPSAAPVLATDAGNGPTGAASDAISTVSTPHLGTNTLTPPAPARMPGAPSNSGPATSGMDESLQKAAEIRAEDVVASTAEVVSPNDRSAAERNGREHAPSGARTTPESEQIASMIDLGSSAAGALVMADRLTSADAERMAGRRSAVILGLPVAAPSARTQPTGYVLPRADWWLAAVAGRFDRTRRWKGSDPELVNARSAVEGHAGEWHWGLWAGRRWRSGTWFGAGIEHTGGRSAYERFDQSQQVNALVNTSVVIFENTVLATDSDTLLVVQERSETTAITGRSSTWRLPLLLGWERAVRRWVFGGHLGLAVEWQRMRDGYLFREEMTEGGQVVQRTERVREADRSFGLVSAQLALDGGFLLTEHWRISAGPVYQVGLGVVFGEGAVQAMPTRLGGQVRLSVDLPHRIR